MPARGIGFDIDHTLLIDNKLERIAFLRLLEEIRADGGRATESFTEEKRAIDALLDEQRRGMRTIEEAVILFAKQHGIADASLAHSYIARFMSVALSLVDEVVIPTPGVHETLTALRTRGVAVASLTNGWNPLQQAKAWRVGFDAPILVSAEIGMQKPDPRAFAALAEVLRASELWYVGDDPETDVGGALAAGFRAAWFNTDGKPYPDGAPKPTCLLHRLADVLEL